MFAIALQKSAKDNGWQVFKTESAEQNKARIARRSAHAAMLDGNSLPGLLLFKKKAGSLRSAAKIKKNSERVLSNGLLNPVEKNIAACGRQSRAKKGVAKSMRFAVAHKKLDQPVPRLLSVFIFGQSVVSCARRG